MGCPGGQPFFATENCGRRKRIAKGRFAEKTCRKRPAEKNPGKVLEYLRILRYIDDTRVRSKMPFDFNIIW